jgi:lincosamide nucleotidyltransferase
MAKGNPLLQNELIIRLKQICRKDDRLLAAMHYGSHTWGEAGRYSDLDITLFFAGKALLGIDQRARLSQIAPVKALE